MIVAIADTHTAIWYVFSDRRLGLAASAFIDDAMARGDHIGISAISLVEMVYLIEKRKIAANALVDMHAAMADPNAVLQHVPLDESIATKMAEVSRLEIPELPDRVIAATAYLHGVPVLSRDRKIRSSTIQSIW